MDFTGVYTVHDALTIAAADTLLEVTAATNSGCAIISAGIGPRGALLDQIQEINVFINNAAGTGTSQTPEPQHEGYAAFGGTARDTITVEGTTPTDIIEDGFHFQNGWRYAPIPEEFIVVQGGSIFGIRYPVAPDASMDIACWLTFGEIG
jgi:hypothetical protein